MAFTHSVRIDVDMDIACDFDKESCWLHARERRQVKFLFGALHQRHNTDDIGRLKKYTPNRCHKHIGSTICGLVVGDYLKHKIVA